MLSESAIHYKEMNMRVPWAIIMVKEMNMRVPWAIIMVSAMGLIALLAAAYFMYNTPVYETTPRLVVSGVHMDVQQKRIFASDFFPGQNAYMAVEMQWADNMVYDQWVHELPITCEDVEVKVVRLRKVAAPHIFVETYVVIQDNNGICEEYLP
jgi:hypothetical protein